MKVLKRILIALIAIVVILVVIGFLLPKTRTRRRVDHHRALDVAGLGQQKTDDYQNDYDGDERDQDSLEHLHETLLCSNRGPAGFTQSSEIMSVVYSPAG